MSEKIKITVIGTVVRDTIYPYKGEPVYGWGGIYYTLSHLAGILRDQAVLEPVFYLGYDVYDEFLELLTEKFPNIRTNGIHKIDQKNNQVILKYITPEYREETSNYIPPPLPYDLIRPFVGNDVILLNFISGYEVTYETCKQIAEEKSGYLYVDFHSLAFGRNEDGSRFYQRPENWQDWVKLPDILQMNEKEAETLAARALETVDDYKKFATELVQISNNIINITLGSKGSVLAFLSDGIPEVYYFEPLKVNKVVDATGCGDSFATGFISRFLKTKDPVESARYGNITGGLNCTFQSTTKVDRIHLQVEEALKSYQKNKLFVVE
ncbi:MAG: carbohydrate kinase family protein [Calditrichaeota bacterium]|nr:carbohydrate kinase family protein [Calditrichota bacterium]